MGSIVLLDDQTINKIAAGEVIERPANVVKEMCENSIDAGATSISIEIENGGITSIRITDNGKGIAPDDIDLSFERHATSKIRRAEDLLRISTMGFRGEALASIASVSKIEMTTRTKEQNVGIKAYVENGEVVAKEECGAPVGTTILVKELFYNTPVRYKFLKKDFTESGYIEETVSKIALIHPEISFKLVNNKKIVLQTAGNGDLKTVIYSVFGKDVANNILKVESEFEGYRVSGYCGKPEISRSNRSNQLFYVNGRNIRDKVLSASVDKAYGTLLHEGKYAFCVLNIEMNPELVDVNVHPAKLEVRFQEESTVFSAVNIAVKDALFSQDLTVIDDEETLKETDYRPEQGPGLFDPNRNAKTSNDEKKEANESTTIEEMPKTEESKPNNVISIDFKKEIGILKEDEERYVPNKSDEGINLSKLNFEEKKEEPQTKEVNINSFNVTDEDFQKADEKDAKEEKAKEVKSEDQGNIFSDILKEIDKPEIPDYQIIGVAFLTYILVQIENEMYIIDQHAAHERILYEKVKANYNQEGGKESQMLLMPDVLELSKKDMRVVLDHLDVFQKAGFELEEFGENTIKIIGVPEICYEMDTRELFLDIIDGMDLTAKTTAEEVEERFIATVACKAAVKGNMKLSESEIKALLDELLTLENPFTCPHGRPTAIRLTKDEIEKKFKRKGF